jgi:hypothetical protein
MADNSHTGNSNRAVVTDLAAPKPSGQELATIKNANLASAANANLAH